MSEVILDVNMFTFIPCVSPSLNDKLPILTIPILTRFGEDEVELDAKLSKLNLDSAQVS